MRPTQLIFIDGLPGLGKTTTSYWLHRRLTSAGVKTRIFEEHARRHPLNVGGKYHPAGNMPGDRFFKKYTPKIFLEESVKRWQKYVRHAVRRKTVTILDSYPFQNSVRVLLQLDADPGSIQDYAKQVEAMVAFLQPALVYLQHPNPNIAIEQFQQIGAQRGQAWMDYAVALITQCPYCQVRGLHGLDGALNFMMAYRQTIDALLEHSELPRLVLEGCQGDWEGCYRRIEGFLGFEK